MQPSKRFPILLTAALVLAFVVAWIRTPAAGAAEAATRPNTPAPFDGVISKNTHSMIEAGRQIFRYDTFGDEAFWGDTIKLQAIAGQKLGGVGPGVSPKTALSVGLKVDADALPASLVDNIKKRKVDLEDPATTLALLKLNSVVRVTGLPRRALRDVAGCRGSLRQLLQPRLERCGEDGPRRVSEIAIERCRQTSLRTGPSRGP